MLKNKNIINIHLLENGGDRIMILLTDTDLLFVHTNEIISHCKPERITEKQNKNRDSIEK
jgi:hypothetical protein